MDKYALLAEEIERVCESPMTKVIVSRAVEAKNWVGLAHLMVDIMGTANLNVLTWDEIVDMSDVHKDYAEEDKAWAAATAHIRQENTGSGRVRS